MPTAFKTIIQLFPHKDLALKHMQICGIANPARTLSDMIQYPIANLEEVCRRVEFLDDGKVRILRVVKYTGSLDECIEFMTPSLSLRFSGRPQTSAILATEIDPLERKRL